MSRNACHICGVWALRTSGRHNVIVATGPSWSSRTPGDVTPHPAVGGRPAPVTGSRLLAAARTASLAQLNSGLGQHPVDEPVGAAGRGSQRTNALAVGVPLHKIPGERLPLRADNATAFFGAAGAGGCHDSSSRP